MKLSERFSDLPVVYNDRSTLPGGLELDIYVPSLKVAFEINGPAHYKPIFGPEALKITQNKDKLKRRHCDDLGIKLFEVDISDMPRFKHFNLEKHTKFILGAVKTEIENKAS